MSTPRTGTVLNGKASALRHGRAPHPSFVDIKGQRFGSWFVVERAPNSKTGANWRCRCDCGAEQVLLGIALRRSPPPCKQCNANRGEKRQLPTTPKLVTPSRQVVIDDDIPRGVWGYCSGCQRHAEFVAKVCGYCGRKTEVRLPHVVGGARG